MYKYNKKYDKIERNYEVTKMLLLNNKSIIDCDENEELLHNKEIEFYVDNISDCKANLKMS